MRNVKRIYLTSECDSIPLSPKEIGEFGITDTRMEIRRNDPDRIAEYKVAGSVYIEIFNTDDRMYRPFEDCDPEDKFENIAKWNDLTQIDIQYTDGTDDHFLLPYTETEIEDGILCNGDMKTWVSEEGHLYVVIDHNKGIEDLFPKKKKPENRNIPYYTKDGVNGNSRIYQFYPDKEKVNMIYFSPDATHNDRPIIASILISKKDYESLMKSVRRGNELDPDLLRVIFRKEHEYLFCDIEPANIIKRILTDIKAKTLADAWYENNSFFAIDAPVDSLEGYISDRLIEAANNGALYVNGITNPYEVMDYFDDKQEPYSKTLETLKSYLT